MADRRVDLAAAIVSAAVAAAIVRFDVLPGPLRILAGLLLVLFLPGYAVSRALLGKMRVGAGERTILSLALSVAVAIGGGLLLNLSPWRLSADSWSLLLGGVTAAGCVAALCRSHAHNPRSHGWRAPRARDAALLTGTVLVTGGAIALARAPLPPPEKVQGYTELSVVRTGNRIELKVTAKERNRLRGRLDLRADGRLVRRWRISALGPGESWTTSLSLASFRRASAVEARLFRPSSATPYRQVRLELRSPPVLRRKGRQLAATQAKRRASRRFAVRRHRAAIQAKRRAARRSAVRRRRAVRRAKLRAAHRSAVRRRRAVGRAKRRAAHRSATRRGR